MRNTFGGEAYLEMFQGSSQNSHKVGNWRHVADLNIYQSQCFYGRYVCAGSKPRQNVRLGNRKFEFQGFHMSGRGNGCASLFSHWWHPHTLEGNFSQTWR